MLTSLLLVVTVWTLQHVTTVWCNNANRCPWEESGLKRWSDDSTWNDTRTPQAGDFVVIESGSHVLLDLSPPPLSSIHIHSGASLVWDDVDGLTLSADVINVYGALRVGAENCRFEKNAYITLTGLMNSSNVVADGFGLATRKVIMVQEGGTLELHGKYKTPWTKLAQTVPRRDSLPDCTVAFDSSKSRGKADDFGKGYNLIVWDEDGNVFDFFGRLDEFNDFRSIIESIPDGKILGLYPINDTPVRRGQGRDVKGFDVLHYGIQNVLGGSRITEVQKGEDVYMMITRKGDKSSTLEFFESNGRKNSDTDDAWLRLTDWDHKLVFMVSTSYKSAQDCFRVVTTDAAYPVLELAFDVVGWEPGDQIVVASTDFDFEQAEVREIIACPSCTPSQIRVNDSFRYEHFGNISFNVDQRAEVGLLSRNILIQGSVEDECYTADVPGYANRSFTQKLCSRFGRDTFGGHIKILENHSSVHVQGVELYHMGQQGFVSCYPLHFHMCDNVKGNWLRDNSIHHSFQRCITIHGTDELEVSGNVCYDHMGHGFFLEDSVEQNNVIQGNLGLVTRHGSALMSDKSKQWCQEDYPKNPDYATACGDTSTFWITHPNNVVRGNVAGGGVAHGFMYTFADEPLGLSHERQRRLQKVTRFSARSTGINVFDNNTAHSYHRSGMFFDSHISTGRYPDEEKGLPENGVIQEENYYEPKTPDGDYNGTRVWNATLNRFTAYKNKRNNMWIKGGNINVTWCSSSDSGMQGFSGGLTGLQTGVSIEFCVFIGRSNNAGEPSLVKDKLTNGRLLEHQFDRSIARDPWATITGVGIYQGPMFIKHTYFDQFEDWYWNDTWTQRLGQRPVSYAGAVSFKRDSTYPTYVSQYTTNLTFGYCDNESGTKHWLFFGEPNVSDWDDLDGPKQALNRDVDGSLTGTANMFIVRNRPFFTGPECSYRADWHMALCPYRYVKVEVLGSGGSLGPSLKDKWALIAHRDDVPEDPYYQQGKQRREYLARTHRSYLIDLNSSLPDAQFPDEFKVFGYGLERQDQVRIGVCVPLDLTRFEIWSTYPLFIKNDNFTRATDLSQVDNDNGTGVIFHDTVNGIIFFKLWSRHDRTNDSQLCVAGLCPMVKIKLLDGSRTPRECWSNHTRRPSYPPYTDTRPPPPKANINNDKCASKGSPEGLGAIRWNEVGKIVREDHTVPCFSAPSANTTGRRTPQLEGCYVESEQNFTCPQVSASYMTPSWCQLRCYRRGYTYAGLSWSGGAVCSCADALNTSDDAQNIKNRLCDKPCPGDADTECGNGDRINVWTTGKGN